MRKTTFALLAAMLAGPVAWADDGPGLPRDVTFSTLITTPLAIEGLSGDDQGNLYTTGRTPGAGKPCPVWQIPVVDPKLTEVGFVPAPSATGQCSPSGLTFDAQGRLFIADGDKVYVLKPGPDKPTAKVYANGVNGTNGLAFDRDGNLWTGDGTVGQGVVWKITPDGDVGKVEEAFRVQPMVNTATAVVGTTTFKGIGRSVLTIPTNNAQPLVANGIAFNHDGDMLIADTARGAIWRVRFNGDGSIASRTNCDTTFTPDTLCLDNVLVAHPYLEGSDGIALDAAGNIWSDANERNAIVVATKNGQVVEVFRNLPNASNLRNDGPLETPTSPFLLGDKLCTANSDGNRRDNAPNTAGEIGGPGQDKGKISCMDQPLKIPGMRLPVR